jgi:hypothetical protein
MGLVTLKQVYTFIQDSVVEKYLEGFTETYEDWAARGKVGEHQFECIEYIDNEFVDNNMLSLLINLSNLKERVTKEQEIADHIAIKKEKGIL